MKLYIDLETFSSVDITKEGAYKYTESVDFEILLLGYAINDGPVKVVDLAQGEKIPQEFKDLFFDDNVELHSHSATFERRSFYAIGWIVSIKRWFCSAVKAAYCGLPLSLAGVSDALQLGEKGKLATGKALIRYFSCPVKPTKANGMRVRNLPHHDLEKWEEYKKYLVNDVVSEREVDVALLSYEIPASERELYILDQEINDRGILIDLQMAYNATQFNDRFAGEIFDKLQQITKLENPNSPAQLKEWLSGALGKDITTLAKANILELMDETEAGDENFQIEEYQHVYTEKDLPALGYAKALKGGWVPIDDTQGLGYGEGFNTEDLLAYFNKTKVPKQSNENVNQVLKLRQMAAKTSIKKYYSMMACACYDNRAHGLFQFYGANRTGRWAGRLIQMQNLPQNHLDDLELCREAVATNDYDMLEMLHDNISDVLSQLIRTTFIAKPDHTFAVADFSAIEARVIAWLADEWWRLEVFAGHGMIYEASAAMMFNVTIDSIVKKVDGEKVQGPNYSMRAKGKVAELALGYQGALGALKKMGGDKMGLSDNEMEEIVSKWRDANPNICKMWHAVENAAIRAIKTRKPVTLEKYKNLVFDFNGDYLIITLPSGRQLFYKNATLAVNKWGKSTVKYKGIDQTTKKWWWVDSYGGKFVENIIQAIARDCLAHAMLMLNKDTFPITMHVHDEIVCEIPKHPETQAVLRGLTEMMGISIPWAPGLRLTADGYTTDFYKKD